MMNSVQCSNTEPTADPGYDLSVDLDNWINNFSWDDLDVWVSADDTTIDPNDHSQPPMPIVDAGTNFGEGSSNVPQFELHQQMMTSSSSMTPGSSIDPLHGSGPNILSSAIKTLSNPTEQSSQSNITNFNQHQPQQATQTYHNQPLMQQAYNNNYVQQEQTHSCTNQSNITSDDQMTNLTENYTQTGNVQSDQTVWVQMQQHPTQNPLPSQQAAGTLNDLISLGGQQQGSTNGQHELRAPVGFATPQQFSSSDEYREHVVRQLIPLMRERYYIKLQQILSDEKQRYAQAKTVEVSQNHKSMITYLETMLRFLSITKAGSIPGNDQTIFDYVNILVNFMACYMRGRSGCSSQNCEPVNQLLNAPSVKQSNQPQVATNVETNIVNFNLNFNSRIPVTQQSTMPSSLNNTSFQIGIHQRLEKPTRIGPSIVSPSTVSVPKHQTNSGPNTSRVIGSGSPISSLNHQPQFLNSEKMKQPMHKTNDITYPRVRAGLSPLGSRLVNHYSPNQLPIPSSAVASQTFDVNSMLTPQAIARSPCLLSSSSTPPSGKSLMTMVMNQKLVTPNGTPCQEPQTSKDSVHHLSQVAKSVSPKALSSSLTGISSTEKAENIIPDCIPTNPVGQYINIDTDNEPRRNKRREVSIPSMLNNQLDLPEEAIYSRQPTTTSNKKPKLENKWALMEEIKEINSKLMETIVYEVTEPSKDNITLLGGHEGVILKCLHRNMRFPGLLGPNGSISSEKMPEFAILFLVPFDYPATSTRIFKSSQNAFKSEVCWKLYEEMLTRFTIVTHGIRGKLCVRELASNWDASACAVISEFSKKIGGKSFSSWYGSWESCHNGSSSSN